MANGVSQLAAVKRIEVEIFHAFAGQDFDHIDGDTCRHQIARTLVVVQTFIHLRQPAWDFDVGYLSHFTELLEVGNRQNTGDDFHIDTQHHAAVAEAQVAFYVKEKLGDDVVRARIDFAFQINQVGLCGFRFGMHFGICCYRDVEVGDGA